MFLAKQSTAKTLVIGPVLDSAGAEYASAVIGDLSISKNGGTLTALASAATLTLIANGQYTLVLTTGNLDTLGTAEISCNKSTYQMRQKEIQVVPSTVYDALITNAVNATGGLVGATGTVTTLAGVIATATNISAATGVVLSGVTHTGAVIPTVTTVNGLAAGVITAASIAADAITDAKVASDVTIASVTGAVGSVTGSVGSVTGAVGSVTGAVGSVTAVSTGAITAVSFAAGAIDAAAIATDAIGSAEISAAAVTKIQTGLATPTNITAITGDITGNLSGSVGSVTGSVGSVTGTVGSVTGAVGSVTGNVGGNVTGTVGSVVTKTGYALAATGLDLVTTWTTVISTVTNLTNAPTAGDLTATMKASVTAAVPTVASIQSGLATPTNITAATGITLTATTGLGNQTADITGTITTATNVTTVNGLAANVITAASIAANAIDAATFAADVDAEARTWLGLATANLDVQLAGIATAVNANDTASKTADAGSATTGTVISGTYASTSSDENTYWITAPVTPAVGGYGLRQSLRFDMPLNRISTLLQLKAYWAGSAAFVDVFALNSRTGVYDQLTNIGTNLANRNSELIYAIPIPRDYVDSTGGVNNIVTIELRSTSITTTYRLRIDRALLYHVAEEAAFTGTAVTVNDIWTAPSRTLTTLGSDPSAIPTTTEIADAVWDEATSGHTTSGTYGGRIVRATNSNVEVQLTGSHHISADVHAFQADVIDSAALAISAVTEIQSGLATPTNITAGTITTVTNLTNLPAITANWITAAGIASDAGVEIASAVRTELTAELADIVSIDARLPASLVSGFMSSVLGDTDHGGAAATLSLSTIAIEPDSANTPGVFIRGTGSGAAVDVKGGDYADGIKARSGDTSGYGICSNGAQGGARFWSTNGYGVRVSSDNSNAFSVYGGVYAFQINSLNNAIDVYSSTGNAVYLQSNSNDAVVIYPGADDVGVHIWGGQTSGDAVALSSNGSGSIFYPVDLSGLNDLSAAEVNAEVLDVMNVDTFAELAAPPAATSSLRDKLTWLFMWARNKSTQTSSERKLFADDVVTVVSTEAVSDNGTTFTKNEAV